MLSLDLVLGVWKNPMTLNKLDPHLFIVLPMNGIGIQLERVKLYTIFKFCMRRKNSWLLIIKQLNDTKVENVQDQNDVNVCGIFPKCLL
jgi:hypothetical protein